MQRCKRKVELKCSNKEFTSKISQKIINGLSTFDSIYENSKEYT